MKVAVIGGGSTYTPELVTGFIARAGVFPLTELRLMDVDRERLDVVGRFAQRMAEARGAPFAVRLTTDRREAAVPHPAAGRHHHGGDERPTGYDAAVG